MKVFKIILGTIVIGLGLGMAMAGWVVATHGQWTPLVNGFLGFALGFMGLGLSFPGIMLMRGSAVEDALGGIITSQPGLRVSSRYSNDAIQRSKPHIGRLSRIKEIVSQVFLYAVIAICVILIAIFSVFRVIGGFPAGK